MEGKLTSLLRVNHFSDVVRLTQMKAEKERSKAEMKDLQQQLSDMHDELDQAKKAELINAEKEVLLQVSETTPTTNTSQIRQQLGSLFSRLLTFL